MIERSLDLPARHFDHRLGEIVPGEDPMSLEQALEFIAAFATPDDAPRMPEEKFTQLCRLVYQRDTAGEPITKEFVQALLVLAS